MTTALFPACVIPGCPNPVAAAGEPCGGCWTAFGPMLRQAPGQHRLTVDEIDERDRGVRAAYALQCEATR